MRLRLLLVAALALAGCTSAPADVSPGGSASATSLSGPVGGRYVALGDSFTSGPYVPTTDLASGCLRSDHNYPSLLAERLGVVDFVDVSCAGARTRDLAHRQATLARARIPAQLDALDEDTTLVTLGIGGNDFGLYVRLTSTCLQLRRSDPTGSPCRTAMAAGSGGPAGATTARIGRRVERALRQVAERAPRARVVLVGYPRVAPPRGECPDLLPYATGDVSFGDEVLRRLNGAMLRAADRAGAEFLDLYAASRGHDVCAARPYVNGVHTDQRRAAAFHPLPRGMRATAAALAALLAD